MMEKKYQLVAWTRNIADKENAKVFMIPSLENEVQLSLLDDLGKVHAEEYKCNGFLGVDLARKGLMACQNMARFKILTGHHADGIRYLFFAARYCIWEDGADWVYYDTDLGSYSFFCGKLRPEFEMLCEEAIALARKYGMEHVLQEETPKRMVEQYRENNREFHDLARRHKEMAPWR